MLRVIQLAHSLQVKSSDAHVHEWNVRCTMPPFNPPMITGVHSIAPKAGSYWWVFCGDFYEIARLKGQFSHAGLRSGDSEARDEIQEMTIYR